MFRFASLVALVGCAGDHVTQVGKPVVDSSVRKLVLDNRGGGFGPFSPPDAACDIQKATYTATIADHGLAWQFCVGSGSGPYTPVSGSRALSDTEWNGLSATFAQLVVASGTTCGADKPMVALIVTTSDDLEYGDVFYACSIHDKPLIATEGLDAFEGAARQLAGR